MSSDDTLVTEVLISKETYSNESKYTSVGPTVAAKTRNNATSPSSTSIHKKYQEDLMKNTTYNFTQENEYDCEDVTLSLAPSSFQHSIDLIEKENCKLNV